MKSKFIKFEILGFLLIVAHGLSSCTGEMGTDSSLDNERSDVLEWQEPVDTLKLIESSYWEARPDFYKTPVYLYPDRGSNVFLGVEYGQLDLSSDTLDFNIPIENSDGEFEAIISKLNEDTLILVLSSENSFELEIGTEFLFTNDNKVFNEDFKLEMISYTTADPLMCRSSFSVEFDSIDFVYKDRFIKAGSDYVNCHQGDTPEELFSEVQEILSRINLTDIYTGPIDDQYWEPFKLMVGYNGKTEMIEGVKCGLHPRVNKLLERIESGGPRNREFLEMLGFSLAGDPELKRLPDYSFEVGEIGLSNFNLVEIEVEEVEPQVSEE